ncbi:MAG: Arc family DNA-binding protein [Bacteroidetes bacterium]|nr:Arc family DNA-binding protein [Bacteroidota bacterium]
MAKKKTFVLRVNPEMMESVEKWAADDFRSINGQLEWIIHNALKNAKRIKKTLEDKSEM